MTMGVMGIILNSLSMLVVLVSICMLHPNCRMKNGEEDDSDDFDDDDEEEEDHATEKDIQDIKVWGGHHTSSMLK